MKQKLMRSLLLALLLSAAFAVTALAAGAAEPAEEDNYFDAGLQVVREDDTITVTVNDSPVLNDKQPTLAIPCDFTYATVTYQSANGEETVACTLKDGQVFFRVARGGTYVIKKVDGPVQQPEEETPTTPVIPATPGQEKDPDTSGGQTGDPGESGLQPVDSSVLFSDVKSGDWFKESVDCVVSRGLFGGTGGGKFSPDADMTRAMVWTVLARLDGQDTSAGEAWYSAGLAWAKEQSISDGSAPEKPVTRQELVTMLWRYAGCPQASTQLLTPFADGGEVASWAVQSMAWAVENGLVEGTDGGLLLPAATATRAQVAAILARFIA